MSGDTKETVDPKATGELAVTLTSRSVYFEGGTPVEVRDGDMRLVKRTTGSTRLTLPEGLYEVSAVLEDGEIHRKVVEVAPGITAEVELRSQPEQPQSGQGRDGARRKATRRAPSRFKQAEATPDDFATVRPEVDESHLTATSGVRTVRRTGAIWFLEAEENLEAVPTATVKLAQRTVEISLPTTRHNSCTLRIEKGPTVPRATAWISTERTVSNALQNMFASGEIIRAADIVSEATELLLHKYEDPTGAALGALILHEVGRLEANENWVRNLARDFDWIPDGKVLLAYLLANKDPVSAHLDEALELARAASAQRMLFTESYSILLSLFRRWSMPDQPVSDRGGLADYLEGLVDRSGAIEWGSTYFTNVIQEDD